MAAVLTAALASGEASADVPVDASLLERISHEREIERIIDDYAWLLGARDFAAYGELFSHGVWLTPDGSVVARGADEVEAMVRRFLGGRTDRFVRHLVTNVRIDLAADARSATATSFLTTLEGTLGASAVIYRIARYHDRFHRIDGRWWFQSRQEITDWVLKPRSGSVTP
jgi:hypothetical protein